MMSGLEYFKEKGYSAVKVNSRKGGGIKSDPVCRFRRPVKKKWSATGNVES